MRVFTGNNVPIKMWLDDIDNNAMEQAVERIYH